jgi:hypothetical protein
MFSDRMNRARLVQINFMDTEPMYYDQFSFKPGLKSLFGPLRSSMDSSHLSIYIPNTLLLYPGGKKTWVHTKEGLLKRKRQAVKLEGMFLKYLSFKTNVYGAPFALLRVPHWTDLH